MTQPLRNTSNARRSSARAATGSVRPSTGGGREDAAEDLEPAVLLRLADFSHLAGRRGSRRDTFPRTNLPATLPVPELEARDLESPDLETPDVELPVDRPSPSGPPARPEARGRGGRMPVDTSRPMSLRDDPPRAARTDAPAAYAAPHESDASDAPPAVTRVEHRPATPASVPVESRDSQARTAPVAEGNRNAERNRGAEGSRSADVPSSVEAERTVAAPHVGPTPSEPSPADEAPGFWDRVSSFRPGIPLLLTMVLATIAIAYLFRPQETPPKRRSSLDRSEPKRLFDRGYDQERPRRAGDDERTSIEAPKSSATPKGEPDLPRLDMPMNAPERESTRERSAANERSEPRWSVTPAESDANGAAADENRVAAAGKSKFATRPAPTEHFDSEPPPTLPDAPQLQGEAGARTGDEEDDGPPPDITGRSYPVTDPANFLYRPQGAETREASRPTTGVPR